MSPRMGPSLGGVGGANACGGRSGLATSAVDTGFIDPATRDGARLVGRGKSPADERAAKAISQGSSAGRRGRHSADVSTRSGRSFRRTFSTPSPDPSPRSSKPKPSRPPPPSTLHVTRSATVRKVEAQVAKPSTLETASKEDQCQSSMHSRAPGGHQERSVHLSRCPALSQPLNQNVVVGDQAGREIAKFDQTGGREACNLGGEPGGNLRGHSSPRWRKKMDLKQEDASAKVAQLHTGLSRHIKTQPSASVHPLNHQQQQEQQPKLQRRRRSRNLPAAARMLHRGTVADFEMSNCSASSSSPCSSPSPVRCGFPKSADGSIPTQEAMAAAANLPDDISIPMDLFLTPESMPSQAQIFPPSTKGAQGANWTCVENAGEQGPADLPTFALVRIVSSSQHSSNGSAHKSKNESEKQVHSSGVTDDCERQTKLVEDALKELVHRAVRLAKGGGSHGDACALRHLRLCESLLAIVSSTSSSPRLRAGATCLLTILSAGPSKVSGRWRAMIIRLGGLESLIDLMRRRSPDGSRLAGRFTAALIIGNLLRGSWDNFTLINPFTPSADTKGAQGYSAPNFECTVKEASLSDYKNNASGVSEEQRTQEGEGAWGPTVAGDFLYLGGLQALLQLWEDATDETEQERYQCATTLFQVIQAAGPAAVLEVIEQEGSVGVILRWMLSYSEERRVVLTVLDILWEIVEFEHVSCNALGGRDTTDIAAKVEDAKCVIANSLLHLLQIPLLFEEIQLQAVEMLASLCCDLGSDADARSNKVLLYAGGQPVGSSSILNICMANGCIPLLLSLAVGYSKSRGRSYIKGDGEGDNCTIMNRCDPANSPCEEGYMQARMAAHADSKERLESKGEGFHVTWNMEYTKYTRGMSNVSSRSSDSLSSVSSSSGSGRDGVSSRESSICRGDGCGSDDDPEGAKGRDKSVDPLGELMRPQIRLHALRIIAAICLRDSGARNVVRDCGGLALLEHMLLAHACAQAWEVEGEYYSPRVGRLGTSNGGPSCARVEASYGGETLLPGLQDGARSSGCGMDVRTARGVNIPIGDAIEESEGYGRRAPQEQEGCDTDSGACVPLIRSIVAMCRPRRRSKQSSSSMGHHMASWTSSCAAMSAGIYSSFSTLGGGGGPPSPYMLLTCTVETASGRSGVVPEVDDELQNEFEFLGAASSAVLFAESVIDR